MRYELSEQDVQILWMQHFDVNTDYGPEDSVWKDWASNGFVVAPVLQGDWPLDYPERYTYCGTVTELRNKHFKEKEA